MSSSLKTGTSQFGTVRGTVAWRALIIFVASFCSAIPNWRSPVAAAARADYALRVQPRVCVVLANETACAMQLAVSWTAPADSDVCVKLAHADNMLQCWQQQRLGSIELELQRSSNTTIQLLDATSNQVLSEAEISIVSRDLRDSRRRRRHVWSIL